MCIRNHDIWWLDGQLHNRNKETDTPDVVKEITMGMKEAIAGGNIVGSHVQVSLVYFFRF